MDDQQRQTEPDAEAPKVFRMAQLPVAGASRIDRRTFVKGTIAAVGAGVMMTALSGCEDDDDDPCVCNTVCPCENVGACECDVVACQCQWGCECHTVCPCESVSGCTCDAVQTQCKPQSASATEYTTWVSTTCTCNTVTICTCEGVCSCVGHCSCDGQGGGGSHYWYPC